MVDLLVLVVAGGCATCCCCCWRWLLFIVVLVLLLLLRTLVVPVDRRVGALVVVVVVPARGWCCVCLWSSKASIGNCGCCRWKSLVVVNDCLRSLLLPRWTPSRLPIGGFRESAMVASELFVWWSVRKASTCEIEQVLFSCRNLLLLLLTSWDLLDVVLVRLQHAATAHKRVKQRCVHTCSDVCAAGTRCNMRGLLGETPANSIVTRCC